MIKKILQLPNKTKIIAGAIVLLIASPFILRASIPLLNGILGAPDLSILEDYQPIGSIEIYDYKDNFVGVLQGKEDRQVVKLSQISDHMKQAVLAAEDSDFFHHSGVSLTSILRAAAINIKAGKIVQGGSTISQQMVKNLFIKEDDRYKRSFSRKIVELLIAFEVEDKYPKERILEIYLNQVYFGNLAYGIERAAQRYFSKPASKLNITEASYLAGLLTAPSYLSNNLEDALKRQTYVLEKMFSNGYISKADYKKAVDSKLKFKPSKGNMSLFPHYFSYVEQELSNRYTRNELKSIGLKVYTGLDPVAQRLAQASLNLGVTNAAAGINQGALVTIDVEEAEIRALVGGVGNFWQHQFNRATNIHTIGSGFKPFTYLTAFTNGIVDPSTVIQDEELKIPDVSSETGYWIPHNFDEEFHGPMTARAALIFSRNIPAVKVAMRTGIKNIIKTAKAAGIKSPMQPHLSLALGAQAFSPLEIATAYSTFARGGVRMEPILIRKITDSQGKVLEINKPIPISSLPERHVAQLVRILEDVVRFGTGALARIPGRAMAGKTGTADGSRDIWFTGFTPDYVTTVWCGNENNKEVLSRYATGGSTPAWIWKEYMTKYYEARPKPSRTFSFAADYKLVAIDPITGSLANEFTPNPVFKRFVPGTEPKDASPLPDTGKIKERGKDRLLLMKNRLSDEDKQIKTIKNLKNETEKRKNSFQEASDTRKPRIQPKPKTFTIDGNKETITDGE
ncbi:MAG: PBP1A family penicillin-binding protein [Candidatus Melainabacteria bacterium]|jgi:penicillin-binding protein 1A|nr:PBP1A family penicillin-binding protein [Candidatus Melainabacteria bacterium]